MSHSPRAAAVSPPCEPTQSVFDSQPGRRRQPAQDQVEPDAVRPDRHEVGRLDPLAQQRHRHRLGRVEVLLLPGDHDEAVGPAERGHRARPLAHRVRRPALAAGPVHQVDQQVLGPTALAVAPEGHAGGDRAPGLGAEPGEATEHGGDELVEGEDGRGREAGQDRHRGRARRPRGRSACPA